MIKLDKMAFTKFLSLSSLGYVKSLLNFQDIQHEIDIRVYLEPIFIDQ